MGHLRVARHVPVLRVLGGDAAPDVLPHRDLGGPRKEYAAIKFFLYTLVGSVLMLLAVIAIYYSSHAAMLADGTMSTGHTFNLLALAQARPEGVFTHAAPILGFAFTKIIFVALFIGFAIKIPMFPFHTWLPDAHVEAPTPVSVNPGRGFS